MYDSHFTGGLDVYRAIAENMASVTTKLNSKWEAHHDRSYN